MDVWLGQEGIIPPFYQLTPGRKMDISRNAASFFVITQGWRRGAGQYPVFCHRYASYRKRIRSTMHPPMKNASTGAAEGGIA